MLDWYKMNGLRTTDVVDVVDFEVPGLTPRPFQAYFDELLATIASVAKAKKPLSLIRVGDGEFFFLEGKRFGNIVARHLTDSKVQVDSKAILDHVLRNDLIAINVYRSALPHAEKFLPAHVMKERLPVPVVYGLIVTRKLFALAKENNLKIGLIGNKHKLEVIKLLLESQEYRSYLGVEKFDEYIPIPQLGTANDPDALLNEIRGQMTGSCDIYLVGIGIGKLAIIDQVRDESKKVILDIGSGIDAISGGVPQSRSFFADWNNFRLRGFSYVHIDQLDLKEYDHSQYQFTYIPLNRSWFWKVNQHVRSWKELLMRGLMWRRLRARFGFARLARGVKKVVKSN